MLIRANVNYFWRHPWQLALALLGICAGVAVVVAIDLANESSRKAFRLSMESVNGATTHQIVGGPADLDETVYVDLRLRHGIRDLAPIVAGLVQLGDESVQLVGVDLFAERGFRNYRMEASSGQNDVTTATQESALRLNVRRLIAEPGAVLVPIALAKRLGLGQDDRTTVAVNGVSQIAIVAGVIGAEDDGNPGNVIVSDIATAQDWLRMQGRLTRIDVKVEDAAAIESVRSVLPDGVSILDAAQRSDSAVAMSEAFTTNLVALSLLAMLVGIFLIYNSVAFSVLQRRKMIGVWRALGVTRLQIFSLIMTEALLLGAAGAALGVGLGILLGEQLVGLVAGTISDHYFAVRVTELAINPLNLAKGFLAGLGATVLAAAMPCYEATTYAPRLSLARSVVERRAGYSLPFLACAGVASIVMALLVLKYSGNNLVAGLLAVFVLIVGYALCLPVVVRYSINVVARLTGQLGSTVSRLAVDGIGKSLSRTGIAIVALAIAVSATIGVNVMVQSFRGSVESWLDETLQSDVYVGVARGSVDPALMPLITGLKGVERYSTSRRSWIETDSGRIRIVALDMAPGSYRGIGLRSDDPDTAWRQFDEENAVLVSDAFAYKREVAQGDVIPLATATGEREFLVAASYQSFDANDGALIMSRATYDRFFSDPRIDSLGLYLGDGVDVDSIMTSLREISRGRQSLIMNSNTRIRELSLRIFDRTFVITNVLYWLAVGVAVVGILGAMLALQLERTREFGILRGVGMTPGQIRRLIVGQSAVMGLISGIAALPLGLIMAYLLIKVINRRAFGWQMDMSVTGSDLVVAVLLAVIAAFVAGLYPAARAARIRPALAMRDE